jgi:hypothetical protein
MRRSSRCFPRRSRRPRLRAVTGDMGILLAAIDSLSTTEPRKAALRRHVWRPRRFRALLDRLPGARARRRRARGAAGACGAGAGRVIDAAGVEIGLRTRADIAARIETLAGGCRNRADRPARPMCWARSCRSANLPDACERLRDMTVDLPGLTRAVDRFAARMEALSAAGIDPAACRSRPASGAPRWNTTTASSSASRAEGRPDLPPVATGGRYDALTAILGGGPIPAVGGVIRPNWCATCARGARHDPAPRGPVQGAADGQDRRLVRRARPCHAPHRVGPRIRRRWWTGADVELRAAVRRRNPARAGAGRIHLGVTGSDLVQERIPGWDRRSRRWRPWASAMPT